MAPSMAYMQNERTAHIGNNEVVIRNLIPKMTEEQRAETKKKIQGELYSVFRKYMT